jgi:hypothetical protein
VVGRMVPVVRVLVLIVPPSVTVGTRR